MQPSHRFRPIRPTHSWLQDRQVRMCVAYPARALAAKSGSAIWPRTTPTRSQCPSASARSACTGSLIRPTPITGSLTARRMALAMNRAYPGGMAIDASIMNNVAVATPIEVLMKSTWPVASTILATSTASASVLPPSISSSPQIRTPRARSGPIASRTASMISTMIRDRP